jgi:hypothetical protein
MSAEQSFDSFEKVATKLREYDNKFASQYDATNDLVKRVCKLERQLADLIKPKTL